MASKYPVNHTGKRFGRITVLEMSDPVGVKRKRPACRCLCDCGKEFIVLSENLVSGNTKSCGCLHKENTSSTHKTHGMAGTATHKIWCTMRRRCFAKTNPKYQSYGARGITVCDRWLKFENFYTDMGAKPDGRTLDRIDNNGNYCKENCRWATPKEQARNTRRNHMVTHKGRTQCISAWAEEIGIPAMNLFYRIKTLPVAIALTK
jgi:hypothetical protein